MQKFQAPLLRSVPLTEDVFQYDFGWGEAGPVEFQAGQFFMLEVKDEVGTVNRSYSVSSAPGSAEGFSLCVKLLPDGRGSKLLRNLNVGDSVTFMAPFGFFTLKENDKDILMIATGTGLAPFMSMLPTLFKRGFERPVKLIFGVRHEPDLFYVEQLREWEKVHPNFKAIVSLSRPDNGWTGATGRVTEHVGDLDAANTQVYICGNGDMVKSVRDDLLAKGMAKTDIHLEQFTTL